LKSIIVPLSIVTRENNLSPEHYLGHTLRIKAEIGNREDEITRKRELLAEAEHSLIEEEKRLSKLHLELTRRKEP
jgi:hypothetical protein